MVILLLLSCWSRDPGRAVRAELRGPLPILEQEVPADRVDLVLGLRMGSAMDPLGEEGLVGIGLWTAVVGASALEAGADGLELDRELRLDIGPERAILHLRCLPDEAVRCVRRLGGLLVEPPLSAPALDLARARAAVDRKEALLGDGALLLDALLESRIYAGHPYGHAVEGGAASRERLDPAALRRAFEDRAVRGAVTLGLRGPSTAELAVELQETLAALPARTVAIPTPRRARSPGGRALILAVAPGMPPALGLGAAVDLDPRGAEALALGLGIAALDGAEGRLAAALGASSTGGAPQAVLVREGRAQPHWRIALSGASASTPETLRRVLAELGRLREEGLAEDELERVRARALARVEARRADPSAALEDAVERRLLGWPSLEEEARLLSALGVEEVARALRARLDPGNLWIVALGEKEEALEALGASAVPGATGGSSASPGFSSVLRGPALELLP